MHLLMGHTKQSLIASVEFIRLMLSNGNRYPLLAADGGHRGHSLQRVLQRYNLNPLAELVVQGGLMDSHLSPR